MDNADFFFGGGDDSHDEAFDAGVSLHESFFGGASDKPTTIDSNTKVVENQYLDIPNAEYHANREYISASMIKQLIKNPYLFFNPMEQEHKLAFDIGNAIHCLILEPHKFNDEFAIAPKVDKRTTVGKEVWQAFCDLHEGKTILSNEDGLNCLAMAESTLEIPAVIQLLKDCDFEKSIFTEIEVEIDGKIHYVKAKVRYDAGNKQKKRIVDIKTCEDASPKAFKKEVAKWLYHVQDAWYKRVLGYVDFVFIAVEKKAPYMVGIYILAESETELGWDYCVKAIKRSFTPIDVKDKVYKSRDGGFIQTLTLPSYAHYDLEDM